MSNEIDLFVGRKLKFLRTIKGMSQSEVGAYINVSFQQIQKYERGINSVNAPKLYGLAEAFNSSPSIFFDGLNETDKSDNEVNLSDFTPEQVALVRAFNAIGDKVIQDKILGMVKALANTK